MTINDIEDMVASGQMTAAQVFTQMKQHIESWENEYKKANERGYMEGKQYEKDRMKELLGLYD